MEGGRSARSAGLSIAAAAYSGNLRAHNQDQVIVAGAGIIGSSIAYHLAKYGARVTLIERERLSASAKASRISGCQN